MIENEGKVSKWDYRFFQVTSKHKIRELDVTAIQKNYKRYFRSSLKIIDANKNYISFNSNGSGFTMRISDLKEILASIQSNGNKAISEEKTQ